METTATAVLWRRLDSEGHDACRLSGDDTTWRLDGVAAFLHDGVPCGLAYVVECDAGWRTRRARVTGTVGDRTVEIAIERRGDGRWLVAGLEQAAVTGLVDVDLGFTPATNLVALRRLDLANDAEALAPAAYLAFPELRLERLEQRYRRIDEHHYRYSAPACGYDDVLTVAATGFVTDYPGLWKAVV